MAAVEKGGGRGTVDGLPLSFCHCFQQLSILTVKELRESRVGGSSLAANSSFNRLDRPCEVLRRSILSRQPPP